MKEIILFYSKSLRRKYTVVKSPQVLLIIASSKSDFKMSETVKYARASRRNRTLGWGGIQSYGIHVCDRGQEGLEVTRSGSCRPLLTFLKLLTGPASPPLSTPLMCFLEFQVESGCKLRWGIRFRQFLLYSSRQEKKKNSIPRPWVFRKFRIKQVSVVAQAKTSGLNFLLFVSLSMISSAFTSC